MSRRQGRKEPPEPEGKVKRSDGTLTLKAKSLKEKEQKRGEHNKLSDVFAVFRGRES